MHFFSNGNFKVEIEKKARSFFFILILVTKTRTTAQMNRIRVAPRIFDVYLAIFTVVFL